MMIAMTVVHQCCGRFKVTVRDLVKLAELWSGGPSLSHQVGFDSVLWDADRGGPRVEARVHFTRETVSGGANLVPFIRGTVLFALRIQCWSSKKCPAVLGLAPSRCTVSVPAS